MKPLRKDLSKFFLSSRLLAALAILSSQAVSLDGCSRAPAIPLRGGVLPLAFTKQLTLAREVSAQPPVVVQLFDWNFAEISEVLPALAEVGYTHIHLSPVQKNVENGHWWGKYQPLDYRVIEGPMGSREELVALASAAEALGLALIVDVVLNHLAGSPYVSVEQGRLAATDYADFSKEDFHPYAPIHDWSDERQVRNRWLFGSLPDLKTESETVRTKLRNHLLDLQECGVRGFRIDSARHIPPEDLQQIFRGLTDLGLIIGEIAETATEVFTPYLETLPEMKFFDFPLLGEIAAALRGEQAMSSLAPEGQWVEPLPATASVMLLRNHDLDRGEAKQGEGIDDARYRIDEHAWQLADTALFGMGRGVPYVFVNHPRFLAEQKMKHLLDRQGLKEAVAFFQATWGSTLQFFWGTQETLAWTLGDDSFVVLSREPISRIESFPLPRMKPGRYRDVFSGAEASICQGVLTLPSLAAMRGYAFRLAPATPLSSD